jgi:hypothetical protein
VELGFPKGHLLNHDPAGIVVDKGRRNVRSIEFRSPDDFHSREEAIREVLQRVLMLNEKST